MDITASNLIYHELIGLVTEVVESTNPTLINIRGKIIDETRNTLVVETEELCEKRIPKAGSVFVFHLPILSEGKLSVRHVKINGALLLSQPENRIKNIKKSRMR